MALEGTVHIVVTPEDRRAGNHRLALGMEEERGGGRGGERGGGGGEEREGQ